MRRYLRERGQCQQGLSGDVETAETDCFLLRQDNSAPADGRTSNVCMYVCVYGWIDATECASLGTAATAAISSGERP